MTETATLEATLTPGCDTEHLITWTLLTLTRSLVRTFPGIRSKSLVLRGVDPGSYIVRLEVGFNFINVYIVLSTLVKWFSLSHLYFRRLLILIVIVTFELV